ncbi:MAG: MFS transporter [Defluviitaleaceae bacterium]|nr:MFS transporter [Defluviitaleaceae bacterium]
MTTEERKRQKAVMIFMFIVALSGLALGLSDSIFSVYFYEAFGTDAVQRGWIELPRELPGVLVMFVVSGLAFLGDIRMALVAQALTIIGILAMGLLSPTFEVMLIFLFIKSLGAHMLMPLYDSIGMSLAKSGGFGTIMGRFNGLRTAFGMLAAIAVFFGFRSGFFSFTTPVVLPFVIAGAAFIGVFVCLLTLRRYTDDVKTDKPRFVMKKAYTKYYILAMLFGARKQIMFVYGPWVLIELLGFGAENMAPILIVGSAVGIFFLPMVGRWIDKFGTSRIMVIEAGLFLVVYLGYGFISAGLHGGWLTGAVVVIAVAVAVNVADRVTMYFGMVRNVYMRSIALAPEDVTPTLATGMALDHVLSITSAIICGYLWWELGPQYVFVFAGVLAACNMIVARTIKKEEKPA